MMLNLSTSTLVVLSLAANAVDAALATIYPCPGCPQDLSILPVTVTQQYQAVPTCVPKVACDSSNCTTTASCSTYDFLSTSVPCSGGSASTLITAKDQYITLAHVSTVLTSYAPCSTKAPIFNNSYVARPKNASCTSTKYQTMQIDFSAPYSECGPLAVPSWEGSGLCGEACGKYPVQEKKQEVQVLKCLDGSCTSYVETWVSIKPTPVYSSSVVSYATAAYCSQSGLNTIPVVATIYPAAGAEFKDPYVNSFHVTTYVYYPGPITITKTITAVFTKAPQMSYSYSTGVVSTKTFCHNGVYTIPISTTCVAMNPYYTDPATAIAYYTTTVTDGPKTVTCTKDITVTFTSTVTLDPVTVISGTTQSSAGPISVSATTTTTITSATASATSVTTSAASGTTTSVTTTTPSGTATTSSSATTSTQPTPAPIETIAAFEYFGCVGSSTGFPTFSLLFSSATNSVDLCTTECAASDFPFAGLFNTNCYCASSLDTSTGTGQANGVCNNPCPGNPLQSCGGSALVSKKRAISAAILLDVYEFVPTTTSATSTTASSTSQTSADPSSDPEPTVAPRNIDEDMKRSRARNVGIRQGGLIRNSKVKKTSGSPMVAKRDFGIRRPFGQ